RIEGEYRRLPSALFRHFAQPPQDAPVPRVHTVEISDGERAGAEIGGDFGEAAVDRHDAPTSTSRPSYASRMCGGSRLSARACPRSWQMCVKKARRAPSASAVFTERSTVECVGCGL